MSPEQGDAHGPWIFGSPWRFILLMTLTVALPGFVLGFVTIVQVQAHLEARTGQEVALAARFGAQLLREHLDGSLRYVEAIAGRTALSVAVRQGDAAAINSELSMIVMGQRRFDRAFVADALGRLRYEFPPGYGARGADLSGQDWFRGASLATGAYVSNVYERQTAPHPDVVAIAAAIRTPVGELVGYLVAQETLAGLVGGLAPAKPSPESTILLVDQQGAAGADGQALATVAGGEAHRRARAGEVGMLTAANPLTGEPSVIGFASATNGWHVEVLQPLPTALAPLTTIRQSFIGAALFAALALAGVSALWFQAFRRYQAYREQVESVLARSRDELEAVSYSLSHDLRTPLRAIDGFSQILLEDYAHRFDEAGRAHLQRVRSASQRMGQLLDDFVRFLGLARREIRKEHVDLSAIARDHATQLRRTRPDRRVEWAIEGGVAVEGDRRLLTLAIENMFDNAWKFTSRQPHARIAFGTRREGERTVYYVSDNGIGFDMAYADKLFQPFQKLHPPAEFHGSGMGLAIVQRIVERHEGRVWAESAVGQGATFYFTLWEERSP